MVTHEEVVVVTHADSETGATSRFLGGNRNSETRKHHRCAFRSMSATKMTMEASEIYISSQQWCTLPWPNRESVSEDCAADWKEV